MSYTPEQRRAATARQSANMYRWAHQAQQRELWGRPGAWEDEQRMWTDAQEQYAQNAPTFIVDEGTFRTLCVESHAWDLYDDDTTVPRREVESVTAQVLLACRTFPLRRVGARLLAWNGTVWCEEPNTVLSVFRDWLDAVPVANQYYLIAPVPGVPVPVPDADEHCKMRQPSADSGVSYMKFPSQHQKVQLGGEVVDTLGEWYRHPERALTALKELLPVEWDGGDCLLREDHVGWLNTPGGMYNLADGDAAPVTADVERRQTDAVRMTHVAAGTLEDCPDFLRALERALPDQAVRNYFQRLMGYVATGLVCEDVVAWCLGEAATRKTTIVGAIQHALGTYAAQADQTALLRVTPKFPNLSSLRGARMVVMSEMDEKHQLHTGRLKALSGGNLVPGEAGKAPWRPQFTLVIESNHLSRLGDTSNGTRRRLRVIPFDVVLPEGERDGRFRDHVKYDEAPGVLAWVLEGARRYAQHGLGPTPAAIVRATNMALAKDDPERAFYSMLTPSAIPMPFSTLYDELARMCSRAKRPIPAKRAVSAALKDQHFTVREGHARKLQVWAALDTDVPDQDGVSDDNATAA